MKRPVLLVLAAVTLIAIGYFYFTRQNPGLKWKVSPDYSQNGDGVYGPRDQRSRRGGVGVHPDNGREHDGKSTGVVTFGPVASGGIGHKDSKAITEFICGDGSKCTVKIRIGATSGKATERIKLKAELLRTSGGVADTDSITPHIGSTVSKEYTLVLDGCGKVRLTAEFEETVTADNPEGIQTRFTLHVHSFSCS
jgi:hypothetical protein